MLRREKPARLTLFEFFPHRPASRAPGTRFCGLRGVGGTAKRVFSQDYTAVDREIERLRPLVDPGRYIPCPDHRIAPDAKWENVQHYRQRMRVVF